LIVQFQETSNTEWKPSLSASTVEIGDRTSAAAQLGSVLNLNFNVVTVFGINFAASLQAAISENMASVFADTTLHGVSGQTISFKNTNTYRYKDAAIDPETGKPLYTGVTREIVAGLTLDVTGSVSGDGMITSKVTAQVSRRGADVTSTTGNPPPTSEKSITTEVRSRSGEPVVLSGLVQDDSAIVTERIPFISRIPLLGWFFKARTNTKEKTEMIIYLVPHVAADGDKKAETTEERYKRLYAAYVEGGAT
jgi:type II secretory pathway component GspD/PulD (secretin)